MHDDIGKGQPSFGRLFSPLLSGITEGQDVAPGDGPKVERIDITRIVKMTRDRPLRSLIEIIAQM